MLENPPKETVFSKKKPPIDYDFLTMHPGTVIEIAGVKCKLQHVNRGKRRLTFSPVSSLQSMPVEEMRGPVVSVAKK